MNPSGIPSRRSGTAAPVCARLPVTLPILDIDGREATATVAFRPEPYTTYTGSPAPGLSIQDLACRLADSRQYAIRETARNPVGSMFDCRPLTDPDAPAVTILVDTGGMVTVCGLSQAAASHTAGRRRSARPAR